MQIRIYCQQELPVLKFTENIVYKISTSKRVEILLSAREEKNLQCRFVNGISLERQIEYFLLKNN